MSTQTFLSATKARELRVNIMKERKALENKEKKNVRLAFSRSVAKKLLEELSPLNKTLQEILDEIRKSPTLSEFSLTIYEFRDGELTENFFTEEKLIKLAEKTLNSLIQKLKKLEYTVSFAVVVRTSSHRDDSNHYPELQLSVKW